MILYQTFDSLYLGNCYSMKKKMQTVRKDHTFFDLFEIELYRYFLANCNLDIMNFTVFMDTLSFIHIEISNFLCFCLAIFLILRFRRPLLTFKNLLYDMHISLHMLLRTV